MFLVLLFVWFVFQVAFDLRLTWASMLLCVTFHVAKCGLCAIPEHCCRLTEAIRRLKDPKQETGLNSQVSGEDVASPGEIRTLVSGSRARHP